MAQRRWGAAPIEGDSTLFGSGPTLLFTPSPLPIATDAVPYSVLITFSNGTGPFTLLSSPVWMGITQIDSTHALVVGTPTGSGTVVVTFQSTT